MKTQTLDEFQADLAAAAQKLAGKLGFHVPLEACKEPIRAGVADIFEQQVDSSGSHWPPHAPLTVKLHGPHPLLILSGKMHAAALGGSGATEGNSGDELQLGIDAEAIPYAAVHQTGGGNNIPQREFFYVTEQALDACAEIVADHAVSLLL